MCVRQAAEAASVAVGVVELVRNGHQPVRVPPIRALVKIPARVRVRAALAQQVVVSAVEVATPQVGWREGVVRVDVEVVETERGVAWGGWDRSVVLAGEELLEDRG